MIEERIIKPGLFKRMFHKEYDVKVELVVYSDEYDVPECVKSLTVESYDKNRLKFTIDNLTYDSSTCDLLPQSRKEVDRYKSMFNKITGPRIKPHRYPIEVSLAWSSSVFDREMEIILPKNEFYIPESIMSISSEDNSEDIIILSENPYYYNEEDLSKDDIESIDKFYSQLNNPKIKWFVTIEDIRRFKPNLSKTFNKMVEYFENRGI